MNTKTLKLLGHLQWWVHPGCADRLSVESRQQTHGCLPVYELVLWVCFACLSDQPGQYSHISECCPSEMLWIYNEDLK